MVKYFENGDAAIFDGLLFRRDKKTGYYLNAKTHKRLHVYVYEFFNGKVKDGYDIHHMDFDKTNNEIENLQALTKMEHQTLHGNSWSKERYDKQIEILNEKARPKASEWHGSDKGKEWHKEHYENMKNVLYREKTFVCDNCGKEFVAIDHGTNRFCSGKCSAAYRRRSGVDNEKRKCKWCGNEFTTNKYSKSQTCSRSCRNFLRWNKGNSENW